MVQSTVKDVWIYVWIYFASFSFEFLRKLLVVKEATSSFLKKNYSRPAKVP